MVEPNAIRELARLLRESDNTVVLTGAGISTESGIPDFRSPGGIWDRYDPEEFIFPRFMATRESRARYWRMSRDFYEVIRAAQPNPAHYALARLESWGKLAAVITQNIDRLHHRAGSSPDRVIELHGTVFTLSCLSCGKQYDRDEVERRVGDEPDLPTCPGCRGFLKPDTVSFGQSLPEEQLRRALDLARSCSLFLVIGSSLVVNPAAQLPLIAGRHGAGLALIGLQPTPVDEMVHLNIRGKAGQILPAVLAEMDERNAGSS